MQINRIAKWNNELKEKDGRVVLAPIGKHSWRQTQRTVCKCECTGHLSPCNSHIYSPVQQTGQYSHHLSLLCLAKLIMNLRLACPSLLSFHTQPCLPIVLFVYLFSLYCQIMYFYLISSQLTKNIAIENMLVPFNQERSTCMKHLILPPSGILFLHVGLCATGHTNSNTLSFNKGVCFNFLWCEQRITVKISQIVTFNVLTR